ncbi:MAG: hypothetical protein MUD01_23035 [Chloroflexaceae bacterium]|nr:hypothetical protein [Chloroflexaceae bacterium]
MDSRQNIGNATERTTMLLSVLRSGSGDAACRSCQNQLDDYIAAQLAGEGYVRQFPAVAAHLDACEECSGAYARLYELALAAAADALPAPAETYSADLSFLLPGAAGPATLADLRTANRPPGLAERLRAATQQVGSRLTLVLSSDLLAALRPPPLLSALRTGPGAARYGEVLAVLESEQALESNIPLTLTIYRDAAQPTACLLEVVVQPPGRSWPDLANLTVTLLGTGEERSATTDAWGLAAFPDLPIAALERLQVQVEVVG